MKISLRELESARSDPVGFMSAKKANVASYPRLSKARVLFLSAMSYHRNGEDLDVARLYLRSTYVRNFKRLTELESLTAELEAYVDTYRTSGNVVAAIRSRISIDCGTLQLTGEIPRVDLAPSGGYAVWSFVRKAYLWEDELRMPLVQQFFANDYGVSTKQVSVGVYFFEDASYESRSYSKAEIEAAFRESESLARRLSALA